VRSNSRRLFSAGHSSIPFYLIFVQCFFDPQPPAGSLGQLFSGGGVYFLHSSVTSGFFDISSRMSVLPLFSIYSKFRDIQKTKVGTNGQVYELP
jgi:hypothetical protein